MTERKFGDVITSGYTYFTDNDIIIAKITPCMENGKCSFVQNLKNSIGFGSTEFHVIRVNSDNILPQFLFLTLNRQAIRDSAKLQMTGKSGHRRVPQHYYEELEIPCPPLEDQQALLKQVADIESELQSMQHLLDENEKAKRAILEKYLT